MKHLLMAAAQQQTAGGFDPETGIGHVELFWAEGTEFAALGYSDGADVDAWPDEATTESADQATASRKPQYRAAYAGLNNKPTVEFTVSTTPGDLLKTANAVYSRTFPISIVVVCYPTAFSDGNRPIVDGDGQRNQIYNKPPGNFGIYSGGTPRDSSTNTFSAGAYGLVAYFAGTSANDRLRVNGVLEIDANAGSAQADDMSIGGYPTSNYRGFLGGISLVMVYEGDITADGSWSDMQSWVSTHYGVTI